MYDRLQELFKNERYGDARKSMSGIDVQGADISPALVNDIFPSLFSMPELVLTVG